MARVPAETRVPCTTLAAQSRPGHPAGLPPSPSTYGSSFQGSDVAPGGQHWRAESTRRHEAGAGPAQRSRAAQKRPCGPVRALTSALACQSVICQRPCSLQVSAREGLGARPQSPASTGPRFPLQLLAGDCSAPGEQRHARWRPPPHVLPPTCHSLRRPSRAPPARPAQPRIPRSTPAARPDTNGAARACGGLPPGARPRARCRPRVPPGRRVRSRPPARLRRLPEAGQDLGCGLWHAAAGETGRWWPPACTREAGDCWHRCRQPRAHAGVHCAALPHSLTPLLGVAFLHFRAWRMCTAASTRPRAPTPPSS